jgi:hypothetical protein
METIGRAGVAAALEDLDFPATREQILDHALDNNTDHAVLRLMQALPGETFPDLAAVCGLIPGPAAAAASPPTGDEIGRPGLSLPSPDLPSPDLPSGPNRPGSGLLDAAPLEPGSADLPADWPPATGEKPRRRRTDQ